MKDKQYFFSHDANAKDDPKCTMLIESLGLEGYGIFWILVETLRSQSDFKYPIQLIPALARKYNTTSDKMLVVVKHYDLFEIEEDMFFSLSLIERMQYYENKRLKQSEGGKKAMEKRYKNDNLLISNLVSNLQVDDNLLITIKQNKTKENNIKENNKNYSCGELNKLAPPLANIFEVFDCKSNKTFYLTEETVNQLKKVYPAVNIESEVLKMKQWLMCNPERAKTEKGMPKFINNWISKQQNRSENYGHSNIKQSNTKLNGTADTDQAERLLRKYYNQ